MGHHGWVNQRVNETGEMRWVKRDTMVPVEMGAQQQWSPGTGYDSSPSRGHSWKSIRPYIWDRHRVRLTQ